MMKSIKAFLALSKRELKLFFSNDVLIAVFFGAPIFFGILVGYTYKQAGVKNLPIAIIDQDDTPLSHKIIDALDENFYLSVKKVIPNDDDIQNEIYNYEAIVRIPEGFEGDINYKRHPHIQVEVNGANMITGNYANIGIRTVLGMLNAGMEIIGLHKKGIPIETAKVQWEAFAIDDTRYFNATSNYLLFMLPGILGAVMQQVYLLAMALTFSAEHEKKTFHEIKAITKNPLIIFLSKSIPYWVIGILLWAALQYLMLPFFKIDIPLHQGALLLLTAIFILSLTGIGIMVSWVIDSPLKATEVLMVISTPSFILSGFTWPLDAMPVWIQNISNCIPLTHFLRGIRKLLNYDANVSDLHTEIQPLIVISAITCFISFLLIFRKMKSTDSSNT